MPELAIMREAKPSKRAPRPINKAKLARDFERSQGRQIGAIIRALNACKSEDATEKLRMLHASACETVGLEHFTFRADGLTPGGRELLQNLWLTVNGSRGSSRISMHVV